jgi:hypothetical protein
MDMRAPSTLTFAYKEDLIVDFERNDWLCVLQVLRFPWFQLALLRLENRLAFPVFLFRNSIALRSLQFCALCSTHGMFTYRLWSRDDDQG